MSEDTEPWNSKRRTFLKTTGAASTLLMAGCSGAMRSQEEFPSKPITIRTIGGAGGGFDFYARLVEKYITQEKYLPVDVNVQNLSGSLIARHNQVYNSDPNGYNIGMIWPGMARNQALGAEGINFDITQFTYFPSAASNLMAIGVRSDINIDNTNEYIQKTKAGELKFFSGGGATEVGVVLPVIFGILGDAYDQEKVLNNYISYDGKGQGITAMKRGELDVMAASLGSLLPFVEAGDIKVVLTLTTKEKTPSFYGLPETQTLADVDVAKKNKIETLLTNQYHRVFAGPPEIPDDRKATVNKAIKKAIQNPDLQKEASEADRPINFGPSEKVETNVGNKLKLWKDQKDLLQQMKEG